MCMFNNNVYAAHLCEIRLSISLQPPRRFLNNNNYHIGLLFVPPLLLFDYLFQPVYCCSQPSLTLASPSNWNPQLPSLSLQTYHHRRAVVLFKSIFVNNITCLPPVVVADNWIDKSREIFIKLTCLYQHARDQNPVTSVKLSDDVQEACVNFQPSFSLSQFILFTVQQYSKHLKLPSSLHSGSLPAPVWTTEDIFVCTVYGGMPSVLQTARQLYTMCEKSW